MCFKSALACSMDENSILTVRKASQINDLLRRKQPTTLTTDVHKSRPTQFGWDTVVLSGKTLQFQNI